MDISQLDVVERELIKLVARSKEVYENLAVRNSYGDFNLATSLLKHLFVRKYALGTPSSNLSLLERPYKGRMFATDFKDGILSRDLGLILKTLEARGDGGLAVMVHPQGYSQSVHCKFIIGSTINALLFAGASLEEIVYFVYKLGTGYSSKQVYSRVINVSEVKSVLESVLTPWILISKLCKQGFEDYGSTQGMFIDPDVVLSISGFDFTRFNTYGDLLASRAGSFPTGFITHAVKSWGTDSVKFMEKLVLLHSKFNIRWDIYLTKLDTILNTWNLQQVQTLAREIRAYERQDSEREKERRLRCTERLSKSVRRGVK